MALLYLDECGEEGFTATSSEWFILAGALHQDHLGPAVRAHYAEFRSKYRKQDNWWFHFQKQSHSTRRGFISHMLEMDYYLCSVIIHKKSLLKPDNFKKKYYLYFYAARFLLETASHWAAQQNAGHLKIIFSSRRDLSKENFSLYLDSVRRSSLAKDYAKWDYIEPYDLDVRPNNELIGLQMADCYASAIGQALEFNDYNMTECCYIRQLQPRAMELNGSRKGAGVRFWPNPNPLLHHDARFDWWQEMK